MKISSSSSSPSLTSSNSSIPGVIGSWALPRPLPRPSPPTQIEFWYDDEEDEEEDEALHMVAICFLEECGVCRRRLGVGRDTYMCGEEAVFCSEECRSEWMEMKDPLQEEKRRRRTLKTVKKNHVAVVGERRDLQKRPFYSFSTDPAAEICRTGTIVVG